MRSNGALTLLDVVLKARTRKLWVDADSQIRYIDIESVMFAHPNFYRFLAFTASLGIFTEFNIDRQGCYSMEGITKIEHRTVCCTKPRDDSVAI